MNTLRFIKIEKVILNCNNISQYYCFTVIFLNINAHLVSIRDFSKLFVAEVTVINYIVHLQHAL